VAKTVTLKHSCSVLCTALLFVVEMYTVSQKTSLTFSTVTWKSLSDLGNFWYECNVTHCICIESGRVAGWMLVVRVGFGSKKVTSVYLWYKPTVCVRKIVIHTLLHDQFNTNYNKGQFLQWCFSTTMDFMDCKFYGSQNLCPSLSTHE